MTKLCPRGKSAAKRKFKVYRRHMPMHMLLKFVQVKLKIHLELKEKILEDLNLTKQKVVEFTKQVVELQKQLQDLEDKV